MINSNTPSEMIILEKENDHGDYEGVNRSMLTWKSSSCFVLLFLALMFGLDVDFLPLINI